MMVCQVCNKRTANTHLRRVVNGKAEELYVCDHCASQQGTGLMDFSPFSMGKIFGELFLDHPWREGESVERCNGCGKSFRDIVNDGRVGCPDCYITFYAQLLPSVQKIHGKTTHVGKNTPASTEELRSEVLLSELKSELQQAIEAQEYERCVELRDRIRRWESESHE